MVLDLALAPYEASRRGNARMTGGGTGTFEADLDGDSEIDGSRFGMGVTVHADGSATGHFLCLTAGASDILGLPVMAVQGTIDSGSARDRESATLNGVGTVNLSDGTIFEGVPFIVTVTPGGPGEGTLQPDRRRGLRRSARRHEPRQRQLRPPHRDRG